MTKWEYVTVPLLTHATKQILDNWGDEGWELVQVVPGPNSEQLTKRSGKDSSPWRRHGWSTRCEPEPPTWTR